MFKKSEKIILEAKELTKKYGEFIAVNKISFQISKGEIFGFLGPNGAGKTTTINMLIGMAKISDGKVFYKEKDVTRKIKEAQHTIGVVADESNLYNEMSGFENLCFCGSLYGLSKKTRENRAVKLLKTFQLSDAANKKFQAYSKGMKRKLTIAAALIHEPEILFLDEPTTGIDVASSRQIRALIKELNRNGTTTFLTTHYIEEAERLCDRVAFINKANIIRIDTVEKLLEDSKDNNIIEVIFESSPSEKSLLLKMLNNKFPFVECIFKNDNTLKLITKNKIDISPIVAYLSSEDLFIYEARLIRPTLEDAFVKMTGIEIEHMKKEKK
jgi:ABC-2 type transport system ATP-binding protein